LHFIAHALGLLRNLDLQYARIVGPKRQWRLIGNEIRGSDFRLDDHGAGTGQPERIPGGAFRDDDGAK
jgi:hypothetical protein